MAQDDELLDLVKGLYEKIDGLEVRIKRLELLNKDVPEDVMVVIAAAVAAYLGERATRRQPRYALARHWIANARLSQHVHHPLYSR